jgi:phage terminase small subunit
MEEIKLTIKQENFCNKYIECGNASESYRFAYNCLNMSDESVNVKASELLKSGKITLRVKKLQEELKNKSDITKERILEELSGILDAKITDYITFENGMIKFKNFSELTERQIKAIDSLKPVRNGIELKLHGKLWTIERICRMLGFDTPEKLEVELNQPVVIKKNYDRLTAEPDESI